MRHLTRIDVAIKDLENRIRRLRAREARLRHDQVVSRLDARRRIRHAAAREARAARAEARARAAAAKAEAAIRAARAARARPYAGAYPYQGAGGWGGWAMGGLPGWPGRGFLPPIPGLGQRPRLGEAPGQEEGRSALAAH